VTTDWEQSELVDALHDSLSILHSTYNLNELIDRVLSNIGRLTPHDAADIILLDDDVGHVVGSRGYAEAGRPEVQGLTFPLADTQTLRHMADSRQPLIIADINHYPGWVHLPETAWGQSYLGAPICLRDKVIGFLNLVSAQPNFYTETHVRYLQIFAAQTGTAFENIRLLTAERVQRSLAETLSRVGLALNAVLDLTTLLDLICKESINLFEVSGAYIWLVQGDELVGIAGSGQNHEFFKKIRLPLSNTKNTLGARVIQERRPIFVNEAPTSAQMSQALVQILQTKAILGVPLLKGDKAVGALLINDNQNPYRFTPDDVETAMLLGNYAAIAIENARLLETEREQRTLAEALREVGAALSATLSFDTILDLLLEQVARIVPYDTGNLFLVEQGYARAVRTKGHAQFGAKIAEQAAKVVFELATTPNLRQMVDAKQPLIIPDTAHDPDWIQNSTWGHVQSWAGAPIVSQEQVIAFFSLDKTTPGFYKPKHKELLIVFASQVALALENARLFEAEARRRYEAETLSRATLALSSTTAMDQLLESILAELQKVVPYDSATIQLLRGEQLEVIAGRGFPDGFEFLGVTFSSQEKNPNFLVKTTKQPVIIGNVNSLYPVFTQAPHIAANIQSWLGIPLLINNQIIGMLALDKQVSNFYNQTHARVAATYAVHAAIAIENTRLFDGFRRQAQQLATLNQLAREITGVLEIKDICNMVTQRICLAFGYLNVAIFTANWTSQQLTPQASAGAYENLVTPDSYAQVIGAGIIGQAAQTGEMIIVNDTREHPGFFQLEGVPICAEVAIPLKVNQQVIGVLNVDSDRYNAFDESDVAALATVADQLAVALEKARLFAETDQRAKQLEALRQVSHDLTELRHVDTLLRQIAERAIQLLDGDGCGIYLYRPERQVLEAVVEVWGTSQVESEEQISSSPPPVWTETGLSVVSVPIQAANKSLGVLNVTRDKRRRSFSPEETALLSQFAAQAAIALENARLYEEIQQHNTELEKRVAERTFELQTLFELAQSLGQANQLGDIVRLILFHLYQAISHDVTASLLVTETSSTLVFQSQRPLTSELEAEIKEIMVTVLKAAHDHKTLNIRRIQPKTDLTQQAPLTNLASMMQVPIVIAGSPVGLLFVGAEQPDQFGLEQINWVRTVADQTAESIRRLQSLLAAEHRRLENLVAHLPSGVILLDPDYRITLANPAAWQYLATLNPPGATDKLVRLAEHPIEEILGHFSSTSKKEDVFILEHAGPPQQVFAVVAESIITGVEAGEWLLVLQDETEARATQERIKQQERLAAVGQLAAGIAHDFNNILTGMIGFSELVRINPALPLSAKDDLQRVVNQGQRAANLVRQILDFSRQSIAEKRSIDFVPFLQETIKLLERTIPENIRIELEIKPHPAPYTLYIDPAQMQQVLTNLAINARDAMPKGGMLKFTLSQNILEADERPPLPEMQPGNWVILTVSDSGVGILANVLPHIFEPFFTTKEVGKGTGLGLAQVYGIVTQHNGYIDVQTQVMQGTTFNIYLPRPLHTFKHTAHSIESETTQGKGELILLVEDDLAVLEVTQAMLEHLGYQVVSAINGRHALEVFDQYEDQIALVLTDMTMPEMGGVALSQALHHKKSTIKVIALTGYPLEAESKELLNQGIIAWLQKPLNRQQLAQIVSQSLKLPPPN
jgi:GAF domain-containing protein/ActR/RegA family two-component response regulator